MKTAMTRETALEALKNIIRNRSTSFTPLPWKA